MVTQNKSYEVSCFGRELKEPVFIIELDKREKDDVIKDVFIIEKTVRIFKN